MSNAQNLAGICSSCHEHTTVFEACCGTTVYVEGREIDPDDYCEKCGEEIDRDDPCECSGTIGAAEAAPESKT